MILGGHEIQKMFKSGHWQAFKGDEPIDYTQLMYNPNSIDVTLNPEIKVYRGTVFDFKNPPDSSAYKSIILDDDGLMLTFGDFVLGCANERFDCCRVVPYINQHFFQVLHGKSTVGRAGVCVHATAGFGDFGFKGAFTFELFSVAPYGIKIYPGMRIAQIQFQAVHEPNSYRGGYSGEDHYTQPVAPKGERVFLTE